MKLFKLNFFSIILSLLIFSSCTNNEPIIEDETSQTEESASITLTLEQFSSNFNQDGSLNDDQNPNGNILFDFCFEFVYPLDLSYNNGTLVTVNNIEDLIDIIINTTDALFINGITFPIQVEQFNYNNNDVETLTINNEQEFADLLDSCNYDVVDTCTDVYDPVCVEVIYDGNPLIVSYPNACYAESVGFTPQDFVDCETVVNDCVCTTESNPVCVEAQSPNGGTMIRSFDNACLAECAGFTTADFVDCEDTGGGSSITDCITFQYPVDLINGDNTITTVNSDEEMNNTYNPSSNELVLPFDIESEGAVVTVNTPNDLFELLDNCN